MLSMTKKQAYSVHAMHGWQYVEQGFANCHAGASVTLIVSDLYKTLGLHRYLDPSDLPDQITLEGYLCHINKLYLHDGEALIGRKFLLNPFQNMNASLFYFIHFYLCITVTAFNLCFLIHIIYFFDSHSSDPREFVVSDGRSVLLKLSNIQQVENHIQVAHLEF